MHTIEDFLEIKSAGAPSFNYMGEKIAYLSNLTGTNQVYLMDRSGKNVEQLTDFPDPINSVSFSPAQDKLIFSKSEGGNENFQLYLFDIATKTQKSLTDAGDVKHNFGGWSPDGTSILYASTARNGKDFDIYVMDVESGISKCVFQEGGNCQGLGFSSSGRFAVVRKMSSNTAGDLYLVDLHNFSSRLLLAGEGEASWGAPRWMPDDQGFFLVTNKGRNLYGIYFYDMKTSSGEFIFESPYEAEGVSITKDGKYLLVLENKDGYGVQKVYDVVTRASISSASFPVGMTGGVSWSPDGKYLALSLQSATKQSDIWVWNCEQDACTQLTKMPSRIPEDILVEPELITYKTFDELNIPAFLFVPRKQISTRLPVIINIHGGPESQYRPAFAPLTQYFVNAGYAVVAPNVRGSSGYGKDYLALDDKEKRMDSVKDLVHLHKFLVEDDRFDANKIFLMGASYGGFMTLAGLVFYPELWAGGISIVGISNFVTFLENTAPYRRTMREPEYGSLTENRAFLESLSPINHVENIKAPLMLIHGANDPRVPLSEAEQMHNKLKSMGRKVELLVYLDEGHGLSKLKNRLDAYPRVVEFLKKLRA